MGPKGDDDNAIVHAASPPMLIPTTAPSTARRLAHAQSLEIGRLRFERNLLLRQVLAVHAGLADGTADTAWRSLLRTARWLDADDSLGDPG